MHNNPVADYVFLCCDCVRIYAKCISSGTPQDKGQTDNVKRKRCK